MDDTKSLGQRSIEIAQIEIGVGEVPHGSNTGPRIKQFLAPCVRNGKLLGLTAGNWCAAFACHCAFTAAIDPETPPHQYRCSVAELWEDAVKNGVAKSINYKPKIGDLVIFKRDGNDPTKGGEGHVGRVLEEINDLGEFKTIEGNENNCVCIVNRKIDTNLAGWISYEQVFLKQVIILQT